ncbi:ParB N-terminal domain-containing protein [Paracoccus methylarcula]|uniref:ParB-like N-terminal domain-containing protein n=1 Tax=Paracoccus methylarcula TaxID=72022 RepID=A0A3R7LKL9_9RHOB|nr:ParB N-terminal domain-containing protein [Paracoccus methylarcula]RNF35059.1 hypothetical protein A7A09_008835 [Paracoccus methylarcula]
MSDYRQINIDGMFPVTPSSQPAPQLMWIEIDKLVIDDRYQRPLNSGNLAAIRRIAGDFRWSRFSPIVVAPVEGGKYALIDGQHRAHAAALCSFEKIPAMVALVAPEEQALAFIEINTRQIRVNTQSVYRAALTAGETWALRCREAVSDAGCRLMSSNYTTKAKKPGMVFAVSLIKKLIERDQDAVVTKGLTALLEYDPNSVANFSNDLLTPWLGAIAESQVDVNNCLAALREKRPWLVIEAADRLAAEDGRPKAACRREFFAMLLRGRKAA